MAAAWEVEMFFPHHSCLSSSSEEVFPKVLPPAFTPPGCWQEGEGVGQPDRLMEQSLS